MNLKPIIFILSLLCSNSIYTQNHTLKYNNNINYKIDLINQKFENLTAIPNCPNCYTIRECLFYFYGKLEPEKEVALLKRIREMAIQSIEKNQVLILTYGTNGEGGLGMEDLDKTTKKFKYLFVSVSNSCQAINLPKVIAAFNEITLKYLDTQYGEVWRESLLKKLRKEGLQAISY